MASQPKCVCSSWIWSGRRVRSASDTFKTSSVLSSVVLYLHESALLCCHASAVSSIPLLSECW